MSELSDISRQAKEAYIDSKMEQIRQKNRELQQRYLEIEADKQNAEVNSSAALAKQLSHQDNNSEKVVKNIKSTPHRRKPKQVEQQHQSPSQQQQGGRNDFSQRRQQRLSEDENPPPDPSYNFLYDRFRVGKESEEQQQQSRRHPSNYGGQDFSNVKNSMQIRKRHEREHPPGPPRNKMEMTLTMTGHERTKYEEWKRIQDQCDKERVARQKTASGEWKREWDRDKVIQDDDNDRWFRRGGYRGRGYGRGNSFGRGSQQDRDCGRHVGDGDAPPVRSRGRGVRRPNAKRYSDSRPESDRSFSESEFNDRQVNVGKDSLKIRVSNDLSSPEGVKLTRDLVKTPEYTRPPPPRRVGSGRLMSNSSQSEDEKGYEERESRRGKAPFRNQGSRRQANNFGRANSESSTEKKEESGTLESEKLINKIKDLDVSAGESGGGDESWEDVTTSGNESQDLSCPAEDVIGLESETFLEEIETKVNDVINNKNEVKIDDIKDSKDANEVKDPIEVNDVKDANEVKDPIEVNDVKDANEVKDPIEVNDLKEVLSENNHGVTLPIKDDIAAENQVIKTETDDLNDDKKEDDTLAESGENMENFEEKRIKEEVSNFDDKIKNEEEGLTKQNQREEIEGTESREISQEVSENVEQSEEKNCNENSVNDTETKLVEEKAEISQDVDDQVEKTIDVECDNSVEESDSKIEAAENKDTHLELTEESADGKIDVKCEDIENSQNQESDKESDAAQNKEVEILEKSQVSEVKESEIPSDGN